MHEDIMSLVIYENKVTFVEGMRVKFSVMLSFGSNFGRFYGFQCNLTIFIGMLEHDKSLF